MATEVSLHVYARIAVNPMDKERVLCITRKSQHNNHCGVSYTAIVSIFVIKVVLFCISANQKVASYHRDLQFL